VASLTQVGAVPTSDAYLPIASGKCADPPREKRGKYDYY